MYNQGLQLGIHRKRNHIEDSATIKGKRPNFLLLNSRALLFTGEDATSKAKLEDALEELSDKLQDWGAALHGKVLQSGPPLEQTQYSLVTTEPESSDCFFVKQQGMHSVA